MLCSYRLLFSPIYQERRDELSVAPGEGTVGARLAGLVHRTSEQVGRAILAAGVQKFTFRILFQTLGL